MIAPTTAPVDAGIEPGPAPAPLAAITPPSGPGRRPADLVAGIGLYAASIGIALLLAAGLVAFTGGSPGAVLDALLDGAIRRPGAIGRTLTTAAPLLLVACGAIIANRAGLANIGQEGQLLAGSAGAAYVLTQLDAPGPLLLIAGMVAGFAAGGLWSGIAAVLKYRGGVPEVISTLLLIFLSFQVVNYGLTRSWLLLDPDPERIIGLNSGGLLGPDTRLPSILVGESIIGLGAVLAVGAAVALAVLLARSIWGFRLRMLGMNPVTARRAGVSAAVSGSIALVLSGGLAGIGGATLLASGPAYRLTAGFSNNIGWDGLLVALLARNRPLVALPMAFVFAGLRTGSSALAATGVARPVTDVVQALLILALLIPPVYQVARDRRRALNAVRART